MARILIADDEANVAMVFETALTSAGHQVKVVDSGKAALAAAKVEQFDLILLDQMMTDMKGNDVLKQLKQDQTTQNVKVAILTNFAQDEMVKEAINSGAVEYILKYQVSTDDLTNKVKNILGNT